MTVLAELHVFEQDEPSRVEIISTFEDGRVLVRFCHLDSRPTMTVPPHLLSPLHRAGDMDTARAAATALTEARLTDLQFTVLDALVRQWPEGLADHQHEALNGLGQDTAGKRRLELQRKGLVVKVEGQTFRTRRGSDATVWMVTNAGRDAHRRIRAERDLARSS